MALDSLFFKIKIFFEMKKWSKTSFFLPQVGHGLDTI